MAENTRRQDGRPAGLGGLARLASRGIIPSMSRRLEEMPLFPLNTVLFPYTPLQLHIFEPRYREMISHCMEEERPFGVVLIREGQEVGGEADTYLVGTAARIDKVQRLSDGRYDILVFGERRFRIREFDESRSYLVGRVEPLIEEGYDDTPKNHAILARAREMGESVISSLFAGFEMRSVNVTLHEDAQVLSFFLAGLIQATNIEKQHLLEMTETIERVREIIPLLEKVLSETPRGPVRLRAEDILHRLSDN